MKLALVPFLKGCTFNFRTFDFLINRNQFKSILEILCALNILTTYNVIYFSSNILMNIDTYICKCRCIFFSIVYLPILLIYKQQLVNGNGKNTRRKCLYYFIDWTFTIHSNLVLSYKITQILNTYHITHSGFKKVWLIFDRYCSVLVFLEGKLPSEMQRPVSKNILLNTYCTN